VCINRVTGVNNWTNGWFLVYFIYILVGNSKSFIFFLLLCKLDGNPGYVSDWLLGTVQRLYNFHIVIVSLRDSLLVGNIF